MLLLAGTVVETIAVALWLARRLWPGHWAWVLYGLAAVAQSWAYVLAKEIEGRGNVWERFVPWMLALLCAVTLELFVRLSELYKRFRRDRWRWLIGPVAVGALIGLMLVRDKVSRQQSSYEGLFLAQIWVGVVLSSILVLGFVASVPVRLPLNLRRHFTLIAMFISVQAFAYYKMFDPAYQKLVHGILTGLPPATMLLWGFLIGRNGSDKSSGSSESGPGPMSAIKTDLQRVQRAAGQ